MEDRTDKDSAAKNSPESRKGKFIQLGLLAIFITVMLCVWLLSPRPDYRSAQDQNSAAQNSDDPAVTAQEFPINRSFEGVVTVLLEKGIITDEIATTRPYKAPPSSKYLIINFSAKNKGYEPFNASASLIVISTTDGRRYEPDEQITRDLQFLNSLPDELQLQPGVEKKSLVVFELPIEEFNNNPVAHLGSIRRGYEGEIVLFPQQNHVDTKEAEGQASPKVEQQNQSSPSSSTPPTPVVPPPSEQPQPPSQTDPQPLGSASDQSSGDSATSTSSQTSTDNQMYNPTNESSKATTTETDSQDKSLPAH